MSDDLLVRILGWRCPTRFSPDPYCVRLTIGQRPYDADGYERTKRINGVLQCPHCGLYWPIIEEPEAWTRDDRGRWRATEWGPGTAECLQCKRVFVDTFDGYFELR